MNVADEKVSIWTKLYAIIWFIWASFFTLIMIFWFPSSLYPLEVSIFTYLIFVVLPFLPIYLLAKTIRLQIKTKPILFVLFSIILVMPLYGFFGEERFPDFSESESRNRISITEKLIFENYLSPSILEIKFSPDGRRFAYVTKKGEKMVVVVDGTEEKQYDSIRTDSLIFSPDNKRVAYAAKEGNKWLVVVDGVEEKRYDEISKEPIFSPDSKKVAYGTGAGNLQFVVVNGVEEKKFDRLGESDFLFSQDSQRLAYSARKGNKWFVVVGGTEGKTYDNIVAGSIAFDSPERLHYLALMEESIYLVEEKLNMSGDT